MILFIVLGSCRLRFENSTSPSEYQPMSDGSVDLKESFSKRGARAPSAPPSESASASCYIKYPQHVSNVHTEQLELYHFALDVV